MNIEEILQNVPEYQEFYTVNELDEAAMKIAASYPKQAALTSIGRSGNGHEILRLTIGKGSKHCICFGCPHPNEPIGAMTVITLAGLLAENEELLQETGFTWHLIPCIDPDATKLNEGWFKGPFDLLHYAKEFYRPEGKRQVEWTFPFSYKGHSFASPMEETKALMRLIDEVRPSFVYSLHNTGFGGAYWYVSENIPELNQKLEKAAGHQNIMLNRGETESAYIRKLSGSVHSMMSILEYIDYSEAHNYPVDELGDAGTCSADYINSVCKCFTMIAELPYFMDARIQDESPSGKNHAKIVDEGYQCRRQHAAFLRDQLSRIQTNVSEENPFAGWLAMVLKFYEGLESTAVENLPNNEDRKRYATIAEEFDNAIQQRFFECLNLGMLSRYCRYELSQESIHALDALELFREVMSVADRELQKWCETIEAQSEYEVVSIRRLVSVQVESALLVCDNWEKIEDTMK